MFTIKTKQRNIDAFKDVLNGSTYQEVGEKIGITRERVRQIVLKIFRILLFRKYGIVDYSAKMEHEYYGSATFLRRNKHQFLAEIEKYQKEEDL